MTLYPPETVISGGYFCASAIFWYTKSGRYFPYTTARSATLFEHYYDISWLPEPHNRDGCGIACVLMTLSRCGVVANPHTIIDRLFQIGYDTEDCNRFRAPLLTRTLVEQGIYAYSQDLNGSTPDHCLFTRGIREIVNHTRGMNNLVIALVKDQITGKKTDHDHFALIHGLGSPDPKLSERSSRSRYSTVPTLNVDAPNEPGIALKLPVFQDVWEGVAIFVKG